MKPRKNEFSLVFAPEVVQHLRTIERKYHSIIAESLNEQLAFSPHEETRNRKPLDQPGPFGAAWELRFGPKNRFRAYYEINVEDKEVYILAIGVKEGNRLWIGREVFEL